MKKLNIVFMIGLICALAVGCSSGELQALKEQNASLKKQVEESVVQNQQPVSWYKLEEFNQALVILDEYIETNGTRLGIAENDTLQLVKLDKISERYYLAAYMRAPLYSLTNNLYALVDMDKGECVQINLDTNDYISEVTYDENYITFHCEGNNVMDGFRIFPSNKKYDIAKNVMATEYLYKSLKSSDSEIRLGNIINKAGLGKVSENNKTITFGFAQVDGTILAGGALCPAIKTGLKLDGNEEDRTLYVDFEALVLSKEAEKQIKDLEKLDYITDVTIRNYKDVHDNAHVAVYFKFKGVQEYSCKFQENNSSGFMDFMLLLK